MAINALPYSPDKKEFYMAVYKSKAANASATSEALNISRRTWAEWRKKYPDFNEACEDVEAGLIDFAESQLLKNIKDGKETSLIFFLKNKAPDRWFDRKEFDFTGSMTLIEVDK